MDIKHYIKFIIYIFAVGFQSPAFAEDRESSPIAWQSDYHDGMELAGQQKKLAFVWFADSQAADENQRLEREVFGQPGVKAILAERYVTIRLHADEKVESQGKQVALLEHAAFTEMQRSPGIATLDMTDDQSPHFRQVVSVHPFTRQSLTAERLTAMLELPLGSLTQRTLMFAVRTHPKRPASADSHFSPILAHESESHAAHQANITRQGHHQWESRFHSINARLPGGLVSQEVCAESWPGQSLLDAAEECVDSWRQSSGHWEAVNRRHVLFGYDMKRGRNGVWYAAGIFARRL